MPEDDQPIRPSTNNVDSFRPKSMDIDLRNMNENDPLYWFVHIKSKIETAKKAVVLQEWLQNNYEQAQSNFASSKPVREEISRMCKALCEKVRNFILYKKMYFLLQFMIKL